MNRNIEITLLSKKDIAGYSKLEVLKKYGNVASLTDLAIVTGGNSSNPMAYSVPDEFEKTGWFYTKSEDNGNVVTVLENGKLFSTFRYKKDSIIRPVLRFSKEDFQKATMNRYKGYNATEEVELGEYPQSSVYPSTANVLENEYRKGTLNKTGKNYTFNAVSNTDMQSNFEGIEYPEFELGGTKYCRVRANFGYSQQFIKLSNGLQCKDGDYVWLRVSPIKWLIDDETNTLISKRGLLSGIRFLRLEKLYDGNFQNTEMHQYLEEIMLDELSINVKSIEKDKELTLNLNRSKNKFVRVIY